MDKLKSLVMFQEVRGPSGGLAFRIDYETMTVEVSVKNRGKKHIERIDLKPYVEAHLKSKSPQTA